MAAVVTRLDVTRKEDCPGCQLQRDDVGRLPIGFCGPDCLVRKARDARLAR